MIAAGVIGGLYILCALILLVGVREKRGEAGEGLECSGLVKTLLFLSRSLAELLAPHLWGSSPRGEGQAELSSGSGEVLQKGRRPEHLWGLLGTAMRT